MTQQNPIFLDYFYKQLLSLTYGSVYRYHSSHNNCFDSLVTYHYSTQYARASRDRTTESQLKRAFRRLRKNRN